MISDHCMVNFVKPNLLGTRKEFSNRFVNPITNGQCANASKWDVKLMKKRAHILHETLAGCVQVSSLRFECLIQQQSGVPVSCRNCNRVPTQVL